MNKEASHIDDYGFIQIPYSMLRLLDIGQETDLVIDTDTDNNEIIIGKKLVGQEAVRTMHKMCESFHEKPVIKPLEQDLIKQIQSHANALSYESYAKQLAHLRLLEALIKVSIDQIMVK